MIPNRAGYSRFFHREPGNPRRESVSAGEPRKIIPGAGRSMGFPPPAGWENVSMPPDYDHDRWIADRMRSIDASGIRKVFDLARSLKEPVNLSIGLPDFDVPGPVKAAAHAAIDCGENAYTVTQGI